ncbi:gliding motility lipoprotein GldB [Winogradskyella sp. 3972H.M.0a.05]|uniref:gliding motility lipoprotein GldB n=1 Tax=Winogradskyella sp. 3972H.M.0a.05 TaxID=2950277 RepID=UPI00339B832F
MKKLLLILCILFSVVACKKESKLQGDIAKIDVDFFVERFEKAFDDAKPEDLPKLKEAFPFFFPERFNDSIWIEQMNDSLQKELRYEVLKTFAEFKDVEQDIEQLFQHLKYYDRFFKEPRVVTLTNDVRYREKVFVTDTIVLIALDNYLGKDHKFYGNIAGFLSQNFNRERIVVDLAEEYAKRYAYQATKRTLLDEMIYFGKLHYFKDAVVPFKSDAEKIGYTEEQLAWSEANENEVWSYFVERELLFSTDSKLPSRFINPAPFSKFYLEIDNESPGRLGQYIGWQIVRKYMEDNDVELMDMMQKEAKEIFDNTKYKPRR